MVGGWHWVFLDGLHVFLIVRISRWAYQFIFFLLLVGWVLAICINVFNFSPPSGGFGMEITRGGQKHI